MIKIQKKPTIQYDNATFKGSEISIKYEIGGTDIFCAALLHLAELAKEFRGDMDAQVEKIQKWTVSKNEIAESMRSEISIEGVMWKTVSHPFFGKDHPARKYSPDTPYLYSHKFTEDIAEPKWDRENRKYNALIKRAREESNRLFPEYFTGDFEEFYQYKGESK